MTRVCPGVIVGGHLRQGGPHRDGGLRDAKPTSARNQSHSILYSLYPRREAMLMTHPYGLSPATEAYRCHVRLPSSGSRGRGKEHIWVPLGGQKGRRPDSQPLYVQSIFLPHPIPEHERREGRWYLARAYLKVTRHVLPRYALHVHEGKNCFRHSIWTRPPHRPLLENNKVPRSQSYEVTRLRGYEVTRLRGTGLVSFRATGSQQ